ncbi:MAG: DUF2508 family protein [Clostridiales bacterium]|nr:DUF2508 family protein [Clostridiales bacterium]
MQIIPQSSFIRKIIGTTIGTITPDTNETILKKSIERNPNYANEASEVLLGLKNAQNELESLSNNFDHIKDDEIIDYYTFRMKACQVQYNYFLRRARELGLKLRPGK